PTMSTSQAGGILRQLRRLAEAQVSEVEDGRLLERFVAQREEAAFAALVRRHGPMVLQVSRRVLHDHHEAEDVAQAAFLALARHATAVSAAVWIERTIQAGVQLASGKVAVGVTANAIALSKQAGAGSFATPLKLAFMLVLAGSGVAIGTGLILPSSASGQRQP